MRRILIFQLNEPVMSGMRFVSQSNRKCDLSRLTSITQVLFGSARAIAKTPCNKTSFYVFLIERRERLFYNLSLFYHRCAGPSRKFFFVSEQFPLVLSRASCRGPACVPLPFPLSVLLTRSARPPLSFVFADQVARTIIQF